jgi:hypothetical protein
MKKFNLFKLLLRFTFSLILCFCLSIAGASATPETLGKYPVCEPSAAVKVTCSESGGNCLLVGDNEQKDALFLYPVSSKRLDSSSQSQLALEKEISDIEAIAKLDDNNVLLFGSHSRNSQCEVKKNRQRFLQAKLSGNQLEMIGKLVQSPQINSKVLFQSLDINNNKIISAVSHAIDEAETKATQAEGEVDKEKAKNACEQANAFNAEGAVAIPDDLSPSKFKVWIGLRSPVVTLDAKNYAILLSMTNLDDYQFDGATLLDLGGRGIRELTFDNNQIWGIAGGPKDGQDNFVFWKLSAQDLKPNAILKPEILRELPQSSEGLAIVDGTAYILIDGENSDNQCKIPAKFMQFTVPN